MKKLALLFLLMFSMAGCSSRTPTGSAELPLEKGTTWTYSYKSYEPSPSDPTQVIKSTYQLTETVTDTEMVSPYFIAHVKRDYQLINIDTGWTGDFTLTQPSEYWYIVSDHNVFESRSSIDTNHIKTDDFLLDYDFPLSLSKTWCWQPLNLKNPKSNETGTCEFVGKRMVTDQGLYESPAGKFDDCYELTDYSNGGNMIHWFCTGVGVVFMKFDHAGTKFGFEQTLTSYSKGMP